MGQKARKKMAELVNKQFPQEELVILKMLFTVQILLMYLWQLK